MSVSNGFLVQFDERTYDVGQSGPGSIRLNLRRWFAHLAKEPAAYLLIETSQTDLNIEEIFGQGSPDWPDDDLALIGARIWIFQRIAGGELDISDVAIRWLDSAEPYDDRNCQEVINQLFRPLARDLRRELQDAGNATAEPIISTRREPVKYDALIVALEALIVALKESNSGPPLDERNRYLAEITAGKTLVTPETARIQAVEAVLRGGLTHILKKFGEGMVSEAAKQAYKALIAFLA